MQKIKVGENQPVDCNKCESKQGYQYSDFMSLHYTVFHNKNGAYEGGQYSEGAKILNKAITPYCCNCGKRLGFKLNREHSEILE